MATNQNNLADRRARTDEEMEAYMEELFQRTSRKIADNMERQLAAQRQYYTSCIEDMVSKLSKHLALTTQPLEQNRNQMNNESTLNNPGSEFTHGKDASVMHASRLSNTSAHTVENGRHLANLKQANNSARKN